MPTRPVGGACHAEEVRARHPIPTGRGFPPGRLCPIVLTKTEATVNKILAAAMGLPTEAPGDWPNQRGVESAVVPAQLIPEIPRRPRHIREEPDE